MLLRDSESRSTGSRFWCNLNLKIISPGSRTWDFTVVGRYNYRYAVKTFIKLDESLQGVTVIVPTSDREIPGSTPGRYNLQIKITSRTRRVRDAPSRIRWPRCWRSRPQKPAPLQKTSDSGSDTQGAIAWVLPQNAFCMRVPSPWLRVPFGAVCLATQTNRSILTKPLVYAYATLARASLPLACACASARVPWTCLRVLCPCLRVWSVLHLVDMLMAVSNPLGTPWIALVHQGRVACSIT